MSTSIRGSARPARLVVHLLAAVLVLSSPALAARAERPVPYAWYSFATGQTFDRFEMTLTVQAAPASGTVYPALQFWFEQADPQGRAVGGYFGLQLIGSTRTALFSIWDVTADSNTATADASTPWCRRFVEAGTGTQCQPAFDWVTGRSYRFFLNRTVAGAQAQVWTVSVRDAVTQIETVIGAIRLAGNTGLPGYGALRGSAVSWIEYFGGPDTCSGQPYTRVVWEGPYGGPQRALPERATSDYNACTGANASSSGRPFVTQEVGGAITTTTPARTELWPPVVFNRRLFLPRIDLGLFEAEPNDSATQALGPVRPSSAYRGAHNDARDYYYVELRAGDGLRTTLTTNASGVQLQIRPASDLNMLLASASAAPYALTLGPQPAGRYYILVFTATPQPERQYTFGAAFP